jgi:hydrogenase/urease accessory protein HupE
MKIAASMLCFASGAALAHPHHGGGGALSAGIWHLLTEPDHLAVAAAPLALAIGVLVWLGRRDWNAWTQRATRERRAALRQGDRAEP